MNHFYQQGDVILKRCGTSGIFLKEYPSIPEDAEPTKSNLVLQGQTNSHALYDGEFEILQKDSVRFVRILKPSTLDHVKDLRSMERAEHHAQTIAPGEYFVDQVNEYDHALEESRKIID